MANVLKLSNASYDDLFQRFANAIRLIVKGIRIEDARAMIANIESEWQRRRKIGDAIINFDRPETGMFAALGYHVGHTQGQSQATRREILKFVLGGELPMVHSASYTEEWGEAGSAKRVWKVIRFLQHNIESNEANPTRKLAVKQWKEDLEWIQSGMGAPETNKELS